MFYHNPDWEQVFEAYMKKFFKRESTTKSLDFEGFGMNWGIWHQEYELRFRQFVKLEKISFKRNFIDHLPIDFSNMSELRRIDFSHNACYYWGQEGSFRLNEQFNAPQLQELDISYGNAGIIFIKQNSNLALHLQSLNLAGSHFGNLGYRSTNHPPILKVPPMPSLKKLNLADNNISSMPKLKHFLSLEELDLSGNPIRCNFQELRQLQNIKQIKLNGCQLKKIPSVLWELPSLLNVELKDNPLEERAVDSPFSCLYE